MARKNRDRSAEYSRKVAERRLKGLREAISGGYYDEQSESNIQGLIGAITSAVERTRTFKEGKKIPGRTKDSVNRAVSDLQSLVKDLPNVNELRSEDEISLTTYQSNMVFREQINMVSDIKGGLDIYIGNELVHLTKEKVRIFFRATQKAWENKDPEQRYENIMEYYNEKALADLFKKVMETGDNDLMGELLTKKKLGELTDEEAQKLYDLLQAKDTEATDKKYGGLEPGSIKLATTEFPEPPTVDTIG